MIIPTEVVLLKLKRSAPFVPFLVVTMITPFDAREPYKAVADASFKMVIDSISLGLMVFNRFAEPETPFPSTGTPSITINGSLLALSEAPPRIRMRLPPPAAPPPVVIERPATLPTRSCSEELMLPF